jgi:hypothetical protein
MNMLVALATPDKSKNVGRTVAKLTEKVKRREETTRSSWRVWMPYHRIWISCSHIFASRPVEVTTALNALFCTSATAERELVQLFRPNHLKRHFKESDPEPSEIVLPYRPVDLNSIVEKLVKMREEARGHVPQAQRQLAGRYRRMQWLHLLLPTPTSSLESEQQLSAKFAELRSRSLAVDICLNLTRSLVPSKLERHDIFYAPMAIVHLEDDEKGSDRYLLVDLLSGKPDSALTSLCEQNGEFKSSLKSALPSSTQKT